jgi:hypothetical protein
MRMPVTGLILASSLALLSGCGDDPGSVVRNGDSTVLVGAEGDGDNVAGIGFGGVVTMVGECLGIDTSTVIWPNGTAVVADDPLTIDVPGLGRVAVGDHVAGGSDPYGNHLPSGIDAIPSDCPSDEVIAFYPGK